MFWALFSLGFKSDFTETIIVPIKLIEFPSEALGSFFSEGQC